MKLTKLFLFLVIILFAGNISAQKTKVTSGNLADLKGVEQIKTVYDYSNLAVGDFTNENDYIAKKMAEREKDKPGTGEAWKDKWFSDRPNQFEPKFEELLTKQLETVKVGKDIESEVVMNVHVTFIEPGFNVGVMRKPAAVDFIVTITKGGKEIAVVSMLKSPGADAMGYDFDSAYRIQESFAKAGKTLGGLIKKSTK
jgi:hypothetical protein